MFSMKFLPTAAGLAILISISACNDKSVWEEYADWRDANTSFFQEQITLRDSNNQLFYEGIVPDWNPESRILMHFYNDRELTKNNLMPLYTSTCAVKYEGRLYNGKMFDNSYSRQDSLLICNPGDMVLGWGIALSYMHVGDSVQVVIPYGLAYGHQELNNSIIKPYSTLIFNMKLVDIPYYEVRN